MAEMKAPTALLKRRCAVYTRKSTDEGLEQEFNSLDAQRESCLAYIQSQRADGWLALSDHYDDGGYSGAKLERPALQRLLRDIEAGAVDVVVVYKIDRLTRSLRDFTKLVEIFENHNVTFVSVTQSFSTTSSMGRLTLNMLLSFAQFEREVTAERIRDKIGASRRKGMWTGGYPPLGYDNKDRKLIVNEKEADLVRLIFQRFLDLGSLTHLCRELNQQGHKPKQRITNSGRHLGNRPFDKTAIYKILHNRVYLGEAVHRGNSYPGQHRAIVDRSLWDRVHKMLSTNSRARGNRTRSSTPALLAGVIFGPSGCAMTPTHTRKRGKLYRYYVSTAVLKHEAGACPVGRVPAGEIEAAVLNQLRALLGTPEVVARTIQAIRRKCPTIKEVEVRDALGRFDLIWAELFPAEQARIVKQLVDRIDVEPSAIKLRLRMDGLGSLIDQLRTNDRARATAHRNTREKVAA